MSSPRAPSEPTIDMPIVGPQYNSAAIVILSLVAAVYFLPILLQGNRQVLSGIDGDTWSRFFYWQPRWFL